MTTRTLIALLLALLASGCGMIPEQGEWAAEIYVGANFPENERVKVRAGGVSASDDENFQEGAAAGARFGRWFSFLDDLQIGALLDVSSVDQDIEDDASSDETDLDFFPISFLAMVRLPLLISSDFPHGRFHPYAGLGPSIVVNELESGDFEDSSVDAGFDARAGLSYMFFRSFGAFVEYRFTYFEADSSDTVSGVPVDIGFDSLTNYLLFGASFRF